MAKTEINFLSGFDPVCPVPDKVRKARLTHRFAVIQETHRTDSPDMVFDQALYLAMLAFAGEMAPGAVVTVAERPDWPEQGLDAHLAQWRLQAPDERGPDVMAFARVGGDMVGCIAPEHWAAIGGPYPYADSYTYSIFAREDPGPRVMAYLGSCEDASGWDLSDHVMPAPDRGPAWKRLLKRFLS